MAIVDKVKKVMGEYKRGELHSGSSTGPQVRSRPQAIAIALAEQRKAASGGYADGGMVQHREMKGQYAHGGVVHNLKTPGGPKTLSAAARDRFARNSKGH